jgi:PilZ domain-containing protein
MSELVRSVVSKFSRFIVDRRGEPRVSVRLPFSISIQGTNGNGARERLLEGYTRDVSVSGLGLIVNTVRIDSCYIFVDGRPRKLVLHLPSGPVTILFLPVRSERLGDSGAGYVIGAQITAIDEEDRQRYLEYLLSGLKPGRKSFLT